MTMMTSTNGNAPSQDQIIARAINDSAQVLPSVAKEGVTAGGFGISFEQRGPILPAWGTRQRENALRRLYRRDELNLIRGAFVGLAKTIAALPWEIKGDENEDETFGAMAASQGWRLRKNTGVEYFQEVFRQANFGLMSRAMWQPVTLLTWSSRSCARVVRHGSPPRPLVSSIGFTACLLSILLRTVV